jgi:ubiquinone/menaquinone biosynthesis C-methylase UbiE
MANIIINEDHPLQDAKRERDRNFNRPRFQYAEKLLPKRGKNKRIADLGGGSGEFLEIARKYHYQGILIDGNTNNVDKAMGLGFEAIQADLNEPLNLDDNSLDGAVLLDVIEHIIRAEALLREIYRILKRKGFLIVSTPNVSSLGGRIASIRGKTPKHEGYHYRFFNKYTLDKLIRNSGFQIIERSPIISQKLKLLENLLNQFPNFRERNENLMASELVVKAIK